MKDISSCKQITAFRMFVDITNGNMKLNTFNRLSNTVSMAAQEHNRFIWVYNFIYTYKLQYGHTI